MECPKCTGMLDVIPSHSRSCPYRAAMIEAGRPLSLAELQRMELDQLERELAQRLGYLEPGEPN